MPGNKLYDLAIVGGGLAGLSLSIQLAKSGYTVLLLEKEEYPFHRVCGEYISLESWQFLESLGVDLNELQVSRINRLYIAGLNGQSFEQDLPLGGFGISRYKLDSLLATIAKQKGVHLFEETKIDDVVFNKNSQLNFHTGSIVSKVCCAAFGKRSNLDIKWKRKFLQDSNNRLDNYVGVKYHIKTNWEKNVIGLHNFENGYCGISKIEEDKYCLCYMTKADNLKKCGNNISQLEESVLCKNQHLKKIFLNSEKCASFPLTISQINFNKKTEIENHMLMLGDSAGMITPLCGNGMSIALHTAKIASELINDFIAQKISRPEMEEQYKKSWSAHFAGRLKMGRQLQYFFGRERLTNLFVSTFNALPFLATPVIKMTHGKSF